MKSLVVNVCVCNHCVMNGAMQIIESIESLEQLKVQLRLQAQVQIVTSAHVDEKEGSHSDCCPVVVVNNKRIDRATSETVMAEILSQTSKDVK